MQLSKQSTAPWRLLLCILACTPVWSQTDNLPSPQPPAALAGVDNGSAPAATDTNSTTDNGDRMLTPPVVSGQSYPTAVGSEERSNYLRAGVAFTSAYTDNAIGSLAGHPLSDVSYSVFPNVALDETTFRMHTVLTYAPGFTFYQRLSALNQADQNASIHFEYRLSPHIMFSAQDGFQKTSNVFNQPDLASAVTVPGGPVAPNFSVIAPTADQLNNFGNAGLSCQFARNGMIGGSGAFSNIHFSNPSQVVGLSDASTREGSAFYSLRISKKHYIGASYQYQRLVSYPATGLSETQTHTVFFSYTIYPTTKFTISFFGGPQHSDTVQPPIPPLSFQLPEARAWTPAAGGSLSWQGRLTNYSMSYSHVIAGGGGLIGAAKMDNATAALRQQITKTLTGSVAGSYTQDDILGTFLAGAYSGHSIMGTASLRHQIGEHLSVQLAYTRLRQDYSGVSVLALTPNTNREFISVSYQFSRPLGR